VQVQVGQPAVLAGAEPVNIQDTFQSLDRELDIPSLMPL
jgi:hypothetical protein